MELWPAPATNSRLTSFSGQPAALRQLARRHAACVRVGVRARGNTSLPAASGIVVA